MADVAARDGRAGRLIARATRDLPSTDLLLLGALLFLTAAFGRSFSKLGWEEGSIYVTEVVLLTVLLIALLRLGPRSVVSRVRRTVPVVPLIVFWLAGGIALARGLADWGVSLTLHDVGLVEYSVLLVLVAVLVDSEARVRWIGWALVAGGLAHLLQFATALVLPDEWRFWGAAGSAASGIYIGLYACWVGSRLSHGLPVRRWHYPVLFVGMTLMALSYVRAVWLGAFLALAVLVALAPRGRLLRTALGGAAAVAISAAAAYGIEQLQLSSEIEALRQQAATLEAQSSGPEIQATGEEEGTTESSAPAGKPEAMPSGPASEAEAAPASEAEAAPASEAQPAPAGAAEAVDLPDASITQATRETFANNLSEGSNMAWRLAIWKFMLEKVANEPVFGVGFGRPTAFDWHGNFYDYRRGDVNPKLPGDATTYDVTGPHNSFVNLLFRMGLVGALALAALILATIARVRPWLRDRSDCSEGRAWVVAATAMLVLVIVITSLNVSLEGPFMGIFFWVLLGLLLVLPRVLMDRLVGAPEGR